MTNLGSLVQQAIVAFKANRRAEARQLLEQVIQADQYNEEAWLWLSGCVDNPEEQLTCLENVLTLNPGNEKALKGASRLRQKMAAQRPAPPPAVTPFTSDPFADTSYAQTSPDPYASTSSWDNPIEAPRGNTSVEWGGPPGSVPAHGSGRAVAQPTDDEYDNWAASLPIGKNAGVSPATYQEEPVGFSDGPFSVPAESEYGNYPDYDLGGATQAASAPDAFGAYDRLDSFDSYNSGRGAAAYQGAPFGSAPPEPAPSFGFATGFGASGASSPVSYQEEPAFDDTEDAYPAAGGFGFAQPQRPSASGRDDDDFGLPADGLATAPGRPPTQGASLAVTTAPMAHLFRAIPDEIQIGGADSRALLGVLALAALNLISLLVLLANLPR